MFQFNRARAQRTVIQTLHDDVIKWKNLPRYWPFVRGIHRSAGNSPVPGELPSQRPVTRSFDVFFYLCLNKRLSKQSWGWWFEKPSCPLWRHCKDILILSCSSCQIFSFNREYIPHVLHVVLCWCVLFLFIFQLLMEPCELLNSFLPMISPMTVKYPWCIWVNLTCLKPEKTQ